MCVERKELEIIRVQKAGSRTFFYLQQYVRITPYCFIAIGSYHVLKPVRQTMLCIPITSQRYELFKLTTASYFFFFFFLI